MVQQYELRMRDSERMQKLAGDIAREARTDLIKFCRDGISHLIESGWGKYLGIKGGVSPPDVFYHLRGGRLIAKYHLDDEHETTVDKIPFEEFALYDILPVAERIEKAVSELRQPEPVTR